MGRSKNVKEQLSDAAEELHDHMPSTDELRALLPDKEDLVAIKDHVVSGLPDEVSDHLPGEKKKKKRGKFKKLLFGGTLVAAGTAAFVFARNKLAGQPLPPSHTPPPSGTPGASAP